MPGRKGGGTGRSMGRCMCLSMWWGGKGGGRGGGLHSLSVIAARPEENTLFTLTVLAPEKRWAEREKELREVAKSFRLTR